MMPLGHHRFASYSRGGGEEPLPLGSATPPSFMRLFNQQLSKGGEVEGGGNHFLSSS